MRLTPDHVARLARAAAVAVEDVAPPPGTVAASEAEQMADIQAMLAKKPEKNGDASDTDIWIFAFGSLIWKPACETVEQRTGVIRGWHRSFCLGWDHWFRGSPQQPGLMLSLDRGGQCKGVAYRLPPDAIEANLMLLFNRELRFRPTAHLPRWVNVATEEGALPAIAFVIDRKGGRYVTGLTDEEVADALATAVGQRGSMAEYLHSTVAHLEELGLRDRHLWRLQEMVAERIEAAHDAEAVAAARAGSASNG